MSHATLTAFVEQARAANPWLLLCAAITALAILFFYVGTLNESVQRGESMRQAWRVADPALLVARLGTSAPGTVASQRVALSR